LSIVPVELSVTEGYKRPIQSHIEPFLGILRAVLKRYVGGVRKDRGGGLREELRVGYEVV